MKVMIVSPEKTLFEGSADSVMLPGQMGRFEVLKNHAPIVSILTAGRVECKGPQPCVVTIKSGFVEVARDEVSVCVEQ